MGENLIIVDSCYSKTKNGVCLSFAVPVGVAEVNEINEMSDMMIDFVKKNFKPLIEKYFYSKSSTPYIFAKGETCYMILSFTGNSDEKTLGMLKKYKIKEVEYD